LEKDKKSQVEVKENRESAEKTVIDATLQAEEKLKTDLKLSDPTAEEKTEILKSL